MASSRTRRASAPASRFLASMASTAADRSPWPGMSGSILLRNTSTSTRRSASCVRASATSTNPRSDSRTTRSILARTSRSAWWTPSPRISCASGAQGFQLAALRLQVLLLLRELPGTGPATGKRGDLPVVPRRARLEAREAGTEAGRLAQELAPVRGQEIGRVGVPADGLLHRRRRGLQLLGRGAERARPGRARRGREAPRRPAPGPRPAGPRRRRARASDWLESSTMPQILEGAGDLRGRAGGLDRRRRHARGRAPPLLTSGEQGEPGRRLPPGPERLVEPVALRGGLPADPVVGRHRVGVATEAGQDPGPEQVGVPGERRLRIPGAMRSTTRSAVGVHAGPVQVRGLLVQGVLQVREPGRELRVPVALGVPRPALAVDPREREPAHLLLLALSLGPRREADRTPRTPGARDRGSPPARRARPGSTRRRRRTAPAPTAGSGGRRDPSPAAGGRSAGTRPHPPGRTPRAGAAGRGGPSPGSPRPCAREGTRRRPPRDRRGGCRTPGTG